MVLRPEFRLDTVQFSLLFSKKNTGSSTMRDHPSLLILNATPSNLIINT